ncbi:SseB family protein, partial [Luedemannella flava]|uniref:SseB family protein n=1 Tax=Luedemannella flava TaxID=349316 RepID=UPI0031CFB0DC
GRAEPPAAFSAFEPTRPAPPAGEDRPVHPAWRAREAEPARPAPPQAAATPADTSLMVDAEVIDDEPAPVNAPQSPVAPWAETVAGPRPETQRRAAEMLAAWRNESFEDPESTDPPAAEPVAYPQAETAHPTPVETEPTYASWHAEPALVEPTPEVPTAEPWRPDRPSASADPVTDDAMLVGPRPDETPAAGPSAFEPPAAVASAADAHAPDTHASATPDPAERTGPFTPADSWAAGFSPANQTESALLLAAEDNNTDQFLSTLLLARVVLPVPPGTSPHMLPADPSFPWQLEELDGETFISVFTSPERLTEHMRRLGAETGSLSFRFVQLIGAWPDPDIAFAVNPGTPVGATLPGSQIVALASWAADVGLRADPAGEVVLANPAPTGTVSTSILGASQRDRLTVMQKPIGASQVPIYLERGYDRVHGFVNRVTEVDHLTTPRELYDSLGLGYPGSEIRPDDAEIFVLRWVAHRGDLYRIPYGGPHEAAMRAMQGWVIERPPFRGNGFAPGEGEVIAEFKVDSVRLPHGATMWRLAADGTESLVATFDADGPRWRQAGE